MTREEKNRLGQLVELSVVRALDPSEQREFDKLADLWHDNELATMRRLNASANL